MTNAAPGITRLPLYFGPDDRALFGWYHHAAEAPQRDLVAVVCPPLGHEYVNSHRSVRHLADALAAAGVAALRFDYDGTGDSAGDDEDPRRLDAWLNSIAAAAGGVRSLSGVQHVAFVGLRMGATLAALAAERGPVERLVLWAPVKRGRQYVREMRALHLTGGNRAAESEDHLEPGGFVLTAETQQALAALDLARVNPQARRILLLERDDLSSDATLSEAWKGAGRCVEQRAVAGAGFAAMMEPPHNTVVPHDAIETIARWVSADAPAIHTADPPAIDARHSSSAGVRESIVHAEGVHGFFGVLAEPEAQLATATSTPPTILLPNAGACHHVGPNRLYVQLARLLAQHGFRVLRFDLPGLGDNVIDDPSRENQPYVPEASAVVASALRALQQRSAAKAFVLMGLCSGAHTSFHAALDLDDPAIAECVLINPLTFYYKSGQSLDQPDSAHYEEWQRYMRSMRSLEGWSKLFRDDVHLADIAQNVYRRFRDIARNRVSSVRERFHPAPPGSRTDDLDADLRRIADSRRSVSFVFSRFDPGYDLLMVNAPRAVKHLRKRGALHLWRIDRANHTFEARRSRHAMFASVAEHLTRSYLR